MTIVTIPRATVPITGASPISTEWYRWARDITQRVGGPSGSGSNDLALSQFDDAGVEETKAALYGFRDEFRQLPVPDLVQTVESLEALISGLNDQIHQLRGEVEALKQGTAP